VGDDGDCAWRRSSPDAAGVIAGQTIVVIVGRNQLPPENLECLTTTELCHPRSFIRAAPDHDSIRIFPGNSNPNVM
jgi:hypothetical protein